MAGLLNRFHALQLVPLDTRPQVPVPGQYWPAIDTNAFECCLPDSTIETFATVTKVVAAINAAITAALTPVNAAIEAEATRATDAEADLGGRIDDVEANYATKSDVADQFAALPKVFVPAGEIDGGADAASAFDLSTLSGMKPGYYYDVATPGWFKTSDAGTAFQLGVDDAVYIDINGNFVAQNNANANVTGTTDEVDVDGTKIDGYTVKLSAAFKARVQAMQDAIDELISNAGAGAEALKADLNKGRLDWASAAPALKHVVKHDMGTQALIFTVMVQGEDGIYRNDNAPFEFTDDNNITVSLSLSANILCNIIDVRQLA